MAGPAARVASKSGEARPAAARAGDAVLTRRPVNQRAISAASSSSPASSAHLVRAGTAPAPPGPLQWVTSEHTMMVGTVERSYRLVRPATVGAVKLATLVVLHGREMTPAAAEEMTQFAAVTGPAILVYPAGYANSWNAGACCGDAHAAGVDDVGFITDLVHEVLGQQKDASGTVYLVGYSNGGRLAYRLACTEPRLFSAIATVEAASVYPCMKPSPVSLMMVASTADPLLNVDASKPPIITNGYPQPSMMALASSWANQEGCLTSVVRRPSVGLTTHLWQGCAVFNRIELAVYQGGSHAWPVGDAHTPSAQRLIWGFLSPKSAT